MIQYISLSVKNMKKPYLQIKDFSEIKRSIWGDKLFFSILYFITAYPFLVKVARSQCLCRRLWEPG